MFNIVKISFPSEVDLDTLIDSSFSYMLDGTYVFPKEAKNDKLKKIYIKKTIENLINNENNITFKRTFNNKDVSIGIGSRFINNHFMYKIGLVDKIDDSKAWSYSPEIIQSLIIFLKQNNFTGITFAIVKGKSTEKYIINNYEREGYTINNRYKSGDYDYIEINF